MEREKAKELIYGEKRFELKCGDNVKFFIIEFFLFI